VLQESDELTVVSERGLSTFCETSNVLDGSQPFLLWYDGNA
jgi:hypothetical protein